MKDDLAQLEPFLGDVLSKLEPAARKRLAMKIGQAIRRTNTARIAANEEPDGSAMAPRKPRSSRAGRLRKRGPMFRKIRLARNLRVNADPDGVELAFRNPLIQKAAAEHHYGEEAHIGKLRDGRVIRARMTARKLLGFGRDDHDAVLDALAAHLK